MKSLLSQATATQNPIPNLSQSRLDAIESWLDARQSHCVAFAAAIAVLFAACVSRFRPLEYDEVFTYYVSKLPGYLAIYKALSNGADDHPPLDYWIRHASFTVFGVSDFALRIPSVLALAACLLCVFALVRKPLGTACALTAMGVLLLSKISWAAYVGRSYMLIAFATAAGLLAWRYAADGVHRLFALAVLSCLFLAAPALHYYAIFHLLAIPVAECVRTLRRRAIDWPLWASFAVCLLSLPLVWPLLSVAGAYTKRFWSPVNLRATFDFYTDLLPHAIAASCLFLLLVCVFTAISAAPPTRSVVKNFSPERAAAAYLLLLPFVIFIAAQFTHGLQSKYAISLPIGAALLLADALSASQRLRVLGVVSFAAVGLLVLPFEAIKALRDESPTDYLASIYQLARQSSLPLVIDNAHTFVQGSRYAPADIQGRLFYLYSIDSAARLWGRDTDDRAVAGLASVSQMHAIPEERFLQDHRDFLLFHDSGWLLQDLLERSKPSISVVLVGAQPLFLVHLAALKEKPPAEKTGAR